VQDDPKQIMSILSYATPLILSGPE